VNDFYTGRGLHVYFKDELLNSDIDIESVISKVEQIIPHHLSSEIEMLIIGQFDEFEENDFNAFYDSGTVYVTNAQTDEPDMVDDIVHEVAHSLEEPYGRLIYGDSKVKDEFIKKRNILHDILWKYDFKTPKSFFNNIEYDSEFDDFLYKKVGYDKLHSFCSGLFLNAYAPTSLREYFATGFTEFFINPDDHKYFKNTCPQLYNKIFQLYSKENVDNY